VLYICETFMDQYRLYDSATSLSYGDPLRAGSVEGFRPIVNTLPVTPQSPHCPQ